MMASTTSANVETIVDGSMFDFIFAPRFSPDGKGLAFAAVGEPARSFAPGFISTLGVPGRGLAGLFTPSPVLAHGLPPADVWLINVDGTHLTRLTRLYEDNPTPAWSADGRYIAFGGARGVYLLEVESRKTVRISGQPVDGRLDWSHQ
jgi:Tol biopolymer transport system component